MVMKQAAVNWREHIGDRLMTAREAMQVVKPGDTVWMGGLGSMPVTLCGALAERAGELSDVTIDTFLTPFNWDKPELLRSFRIYTGYSGPLERRAAQEGRFDFVPVAGFEGVEVPGPRITIYRFSPAPR